MSVTSIDAGIAFVARFMQASADRAGDRRTRCSATSFGRHCGRTLRPPTDYGPFDDGKSIATAPVLSMWTRSPVSVATVACPGRCATVVEYRPRGAGSETGGGQFVSTALTFSAVYSMRAPRRAVAARRPGSRPGTWCRTSSSAVLSYEAERQIAAYRVVSGSRRREELVALLNRAGVDVAEILALGGLPLAPGEGGHSFLTHAA